MAQVPNKAIDPVPPSNTRELREQVGRASRLEDSNPRGVGYQLINTTIVDGAIPEPKIMNISRDPGAPLALPFDEVTPHQVSAPFWGLDGTPQAAPNQTAATGEALPADPQSFYNI